MKKLILIVTLVALILGVLAFLERQDFHGVYEPWEISTEDNGREVILHAPGRILSGQLLILTLESNPTTGYSWQLREFDEAVLKLEGHRFVSDIQPSGKLGGGGEEIWVFQAQSPGTTTLHLEYVRPWVSIKPAKTFIVQIVVQSASLLPR